MAYIKADVNYGVLDRNLSPGTGGVFTQEIRSILNRNGVQNRIGEFIAGLGGRDITEQNIRDIFNQLETGRAGITDINWIGVKGR